MRKCFKPAAAIVVALALAVPVKGEVQWTGVGWYVLVHDEIGWIGTAAGPYPEEKACKVEADRFAAAHPGAWDPLFECRYLQRAPRSNGGEGILID